MMRVTHRWVIDQVHAGVVAAGFEDLGRSHVAMFGYPTPDGRRPSELADQLQIAKQSVNDLLGDMEGRGYLVRVPDPADGRARVIRLTDKGRHLEDVVYEAAEAAELAIANLLGPRRFDQLKRSLADVDRHIVGGGLPTRPGEVAGIPSPNEQGREPHRQHSH